ncbi:MAG: hypothetical protein ACE5F1_01035 [Planctomycetota bacterium]
MATKDGRKTLGHSLAGEKVGLWHARLDAAERQHKRGEALRETLRKIVSELEFPPLMAPPRADDGADSSDFEYAHVEQINLNLLMRVLDKLKSHAGDESPEIRVPRDKGRTIVAEFEDRLLTRAMERGGAPETLYDSIGHYFTDGNCALWAIMPFLPSATSLKKAAQGMQEKVREAAAFGADVEPQLGEDPERVARALQQGVFKDPKAILLDAVTNPEDSAPTPMDMVMAAAAKYAATAMKNRKRGLAWDEWDNQVNYELSPLGPEGTLIDPTATNTRNVKWIARRILMRREDARNHPSFHPEVRKELETDPIDENRHEEVRPHKGLGKADLVDENEWVVIWEIWDRVHKARHYVNRHVDRYLERDSEYPYVNEEGRPVIEPHGSHPGFFPCVYEPVKKGVRMNASALEGIPLGAAGLPQQVSIIKLISFYLHAVKQASASAYVHRLDPEAVEAIKKAIPGTMLEVTEEIESLKEAIQSVEWKPPPPELFREIQQEIARFSMAMNFPLIELTSTPSSKTLGQDQLSQAAGDLGTLEVMRRFEGVYSQLAGITRSYLQHYYTDDQLFALSGKEALALRVVWQAIGTPPEPIAIRLRSRARDMSPIRIKQMLDLYELALQGQQVEMTFGIPPAKDWSWLLDEASKVLGLGEPPPLMNPKDRLALIKQELAARQQARAQGANPAAAGIGGRGGAPGGAPALGGSAGDRRDQGRTPERRRGETNVNGANQAGGPNQEAGRS